MTFESDTSADLSPEFFSTWLKKMDEDVALAFVLSSLSLDKQKMLEAFDVACQVMHIRALDEAKKLREELGFTEDDEFGASFGSSTGTTEKDTEDFVARIDALIKGVLESSTKKKDSEDDNDNDK